MILLKKIWGRYKQLHTRQPLFRISYTFACKNFPEKMQTNIWKIQGKRLEKFKHSNGPQNLIVKSFAV